MRATTTCCVFLIACLAIPAVATAQGSFAGIGVKPGDIVRVTDRVTGKRTKGAVEVIQTDLIRVDGVDFSPSSVSRVERAGDPVWDGALLGGLFGVAASTAKTERCANQTARQCLMGHVVTWGLVGMVIDSMHDRYTTVYPQLTRTHSPRIVPGWARGSGGIGVRVKFK